MVALLRLLPCERSIPQLLATTPVLALLALGCAGSTDAPAMPTPIVSMVLIAGEKRHVAAITWDSPASNPFPPEPVPVEVSDVELVILDETGARYAVEADGEPGRYSAGLSVGPGQRYWLEGSIAGVRISAETRVPSGFAMIEPADDTIRVDRNVGFWGMPYHFAVDGASAFVLQVVSPDGISPNGSITDPSDTLRLRFLGNTGSPPFHLRVLALDQAAAGWLVSRAPQSNVEGAFGGFGSAAVVLRPLISE